MAKNRVLIENDSVVDSDDFGQYCHWKEKYLPNNELSFFFGRIITDASDRPIDVWEAILWADEIWIDSSFIGDSERLLNKMLTTAIENSIKNKTVINMRERNDVGWHISEETALLIQAAKKQGIDFIYSDSKDYRKYLPK